MRWVSQGLNPFYALTGIIEKNNPTERPWNVDSTEDQLAVLQTV